MQYRHWNAERFTHEEEVSLIIAGQAGDFESRNRVILSQTGIIWIEAHRRALGDDLLADELANEAVYGLIRTFHKFDVTRNLRYSTWAKFTIKQRMQYYMAHRFKIMREQLGPILSLDKVKEDAGVEAQDQKSFQDTLEMREMAACLGEFVAGLTDAFEKEMMLMRLAGKTLREIGRSLNKSRQYILHVQRQVIKRFQRLLLDKQPNNSVEY